MTDAWSDGRARPQEESQHGWGLRSITASQLYTTRQGIGLVLQIYYSVAIRAGSTPAFS